MWTKGLNNTLSLSFFILKIHLLKELYFVIIAIMCVIRSLI